MGIKNENNENKRNKLYLRLNKNIIHIYYLNMSIYKFKSFLSLWFVSLT